MHYCLNKQIDIDKDRLTVLEILIAGQPLLYSTNEEALKLIKDLGMPAIYYEPIKSFFQTQNHACVDRKTINQLIDSLYPDPNKHQKKS